VHEDYPYITGELHPNGDIRWSHGFMSSTGTSPCNGWCKTTFDDWYDKVGYDYKYADPTRKSEVEYKVVKKDG